MRPPYGFFSVSLLIKYNIAGQHIHPTAGRGGDSRHAGGLQAGQRGQNQHMFWGGEGGSITKFQLAKSLFSIDFSFVFYLR